MPQIQDVITQMHSQRRMLLGALPGSASAWLFCRVAESQPARQIVIAAHNEERARTLHADLQCFLPSTHAERLCLLPELDVLPYTQLAPDPLIRAALISWLDRIHRREPLITVASMPALLRRMPPRSFLAEHTLDVAVGATLDRDRLTEQLIAMGFEETPLVDDPGTVAARGSIVDAWPIGNQHPIRIELDDDHVVALRPFSPGTQRSRGDLRSVRLLPARDFALSVEARRTALTRIRAFADAADMSASERRGLTELVQAGIAFPGIDTFLPAFHDGLTLCNQHLALDALVVVEDEGQCRIAAERLLHKLHDLHDHSSSRERIIPVNTLYADWKELQRDLEAFSQLIQAPAVSHAGERVLSLAATSTADMRAQAVSGSSEDEPLQRIARALSQFLAEGLHIVIFCPNEIAQQRLREVLQHHHLPIELLDGPLSSLITASRTCVRLGIGRPSGSFRWDDERLLVISEADLFGKQRGHKSARRISTPSEPFLSFAELAEGDLLVHEQHGIGRYMGLVHMHIGRDAGDYVLLEYLGGDKLYLPVYRMNLVQKYVGPGDEAPALDRLGGTRWVTLKKKVRQEIRQLARELLRVQAARQSQPGFAFPSGDMAYEEFCAAFPFEETPDQLAAIEQVMQDMSAPRAMDRLICGDVGFGKTEVAMRAAFRAVSAGKQALILVPTTVLALQHHESFTKRFSGTPVVVEMLSRFRSRAEQKDILERFQAGKIDILIGTHRLLQKDVKPARLGLLIVDEEQRFGVTHKERLKQMKTLVDVLTLTATPIPRTLNMSLMGMRDISTITTPPADRQSISTHVAPFDEGIVRYAIMQELERGGQVFFVHNRVQTIHTMRDLLGRVAPKARVVVAHGQMPEDELERVMLEFLHQQHDVLLCTTIIESGLDIPNANTIIINRADNMGLAQLYQLRGRVGRSDRQAYAYLLTSQTGEMTAIAQRRLSALQRFTDLGSGFHIAMHDLEIRGAGNLLGAAQSGHIASVGYELYAKLLARAVRRLSEEQEEEEIDPELHLGLAAFLPENYVADTGTRIELYRRLANCEESSQVEQLAEEVQDRFGALPEPAQLLIGVMEVKMLARMLRARSITNDGKQFGVTLDASTPLHPEHVLILAQQERGRYHIVPPDKLILKHNAQNPQETIAEVKKLLRALVQSASAPAL